MAKSSGRHRNEILIVFTVDTWLGAEVTSDATGQYWPVDNYHVVVLTRFVYIGATFSETNIETEVNKSMVLHQRLLTIDWWFPNTAFLAD